MNKKQLIHKFEDEFKKTKIFIIILMLLLFIIFVSILYSAFKGESIIAEMMALYIIPVIILCMALHGTSIQNNIKILKVE